MLSRDGVMGSMIMTMIRKMLRNDSTEDSRKEIFLPVEIITEILSWLPAKAVLRFKCTCKLWLSITEDAKFICKHATRFREEMISVPIKNKLHYIRGIYNGLILEKMDLASNSYRLRNPTTRRVLNLPDPDETEPYRWVLPCYSQRSGTFKMVFPCPNQSKDGNGSLKILSLGVDDSWRTIDFPFHCRLTDARWIPMSLDEDYVLAVLPKNNSLGRGGMVIFLEEQSEKLWRIEIPWGLVVDAGTFHLMTWAEKPALARRSNDGDELHVWVFEDYKEQRWPSKIVIDLKSIEEEDRDYTPYCWRNNKLWMHRHHGRRLCLDRNVVKYVDRPHTLSCQPSLVDLKGMKPLC